jgi:hypothetical protein
MHFLKIRFQKKFFFQKEDKQSDYFFTSIYRFLMGTALQQFNQGEKVDL